MDKRLPQPVPGLGPVAAVAAGAYHTCALELDGDVRCWGSNEYGQLGIAAAGGSFSTPQLISAFSGFMKLVFGDGFELIAPGVLK